MSVKVSSWVWHDEQTDDINGNEMILLLALADVADDYGRCRFMMDEGDLTYDALARKVRVDRRTIERLIPKLRDRGLLSHARGTKTRPNEFAILVPWAQTSADKVSGNVSDAPTAVQDSPTAATIFPDNGGVDTPLLRIDVKDVDAVSFDDDELPKGTRAPAAFPKPFTVTRDMREWAAGKAPSLDVNEVTQEFVAYWRVGEGAGKRRKNWTLTWRTWLKRSHDRNVERGWVAPVVAPVRAIAPWWCEVLRIHPDEYVERRGEAGWAEEMERLAAKRTAS